MIDDWSALVSKAKRQGRRDAQRNRACDPGDYFGGARDAYIAAYVKEQDQ